MINNINDFKKFCTLVVKKYIYTHAHTHPYKFIERKKGARSDTVPEDNYILVIVIQGWKRIV